jgi:hypothetical protein
MFFFEKNGRDDIPPNCSIALVNYWVLALQRWTGLKKKALGFVLVFKFCL